MAVPAFFFAVLTTLLGLGASAPLTCPNVQDLSPCACRRLAFGLHVTCANFNSSGSLLKAMRILRDFEVHTVLLHGLFIRDTLPEDLFQGMQIKEIHVENSRMRFSKPAFSGLDSSLNMLYVAADSQIKSDDNFSLARLPKLNKLSVKNNGLHRVNDTWLNDVVPNVEKVTLDFNQIEEIESHAFSGLLHLQQLLMADNHIKTIQRSMFPDPANHLVKIDLSSNKISEFPSDIFSAMPKLREVILTSNELKTVEREVWIPVWEKLDKLILIENHIVCDDKMKWIKNYFQPKRLEATCCDPPNLKNKPVTEVFK